MKLVGIILLISCAFAAERDLFKTCQQSSFCRRCRTVSGPSKYEAIVDTLQTDNNGITIDLRNNENNQFFILKLKALQDNTFRFEIDEKTPLKPRYRVSEGLYQNPSYEVVDVSSTATEIIVKSKSNRAVIKLNPLQIDFYENDMLSVSVNSKGLMRVEHLRVKPQTLDPSEDPDSWEETFRNVVDTKPRGPEAVAVDFTFPQSDVLFGIPEHADSFALKVTKDDEPYRLYTLDVTGYEVNSRMPIYGAIPVIYGHGALRTAGIFWHNSADTFVDIHDKKTTHFISEAGIIDVFVFLGPKPNQAFSQYTKLTGVTNLPSLFSLAYHQSRWNYLNQPEAIGVVDKFDENDLQLDTLWLDIEYTDGKRYFTWNYTAFPTPLEMINYFRSSGRHLTYIIDPHIKKDINYFFYRENRDRGFFIKHNNGSDFEGSCWPEMSSYVDYFNPEASRFYADQYLLKNFADNAIDTGIWNDMNEPTVFDVPEKTIAKDNVHFGGWEHRNLHSQYALMQVKGTFDGMMRRANGEERPFILTRAFWSGVQRYSAVWTGDNGNTWEYLQASIKMCLSISVSGISFCGSDVGGFFGDPEQDLLVRWYQAAAYQPFFRSHANIDSKYREPYLLPAAEMEIVRQAIRKRYALLPLWYTMFFEHERNGSPVMRPLLSEYPLDTNTFTLDEQYMLSDKLLVRPVIHKGVSKVDVYFPSIDGVKESEIWYDTDDYTKFETAGVQSIDVDTLKIPVYQRGGTIIPKKEIVRKASAHMIDDPVSLFVAIDKAEQASGTLFIDNEKNFDYRRGKFIYLHFTLANGTLSSKLIEPTGGYETKSQIDRILIAGYKEVPTSATIETTNGDRSLEIINITDTFFVLSKVDANLGEEWTIVLNAATQSVVGASLLIATFLLQVLRNFF